MVSFSIPGKPGKAGHIFCSAHGDDGRIHFSAYRKQGNFFHPKVVKVGEFACTVAELEIFVRHAREEEARRAK